MNYVLDEIFGLQSDCCQYINYETNIVPNYAQNVAVKIQQNSAEKRSAQRSVAIDQNITQRHVLLTLLLLSYIIVLIAATKGNVLKIFADDFP